MKLLDLIYDFKIKVKNKYKKLFKETEKNRDILKRTTHFLDYAFTHGVIPVVFDSWYDGKHFISFRTSKDLDVVKGHLKYQSIAKVQITDSSNPKILLNEITEELGPHLKATFSPVTIMDIDLLEEIKILEALQNYYKQFKDLQLLANYSETDDSKLKHTKNMLKSNINIFYKKNLEFFTSKTLYPLFSKTGILVEKIPEYYLIHHLRYTYKEEKNVYNFLVYDMQSLKEKCFFIWNEIENLEMDELNELRRSLDEYDYYDEIKHYFITIIKALFILRDVDILKLKYVPDSKIVFLMVDIPIEVENFIKDNFENMDIAVVVKMKAILPNNHYYFLNTRKEPEKEQKC